MAASEPRPQRPPHHRWPLSEKRRIVELTLREGASVSVIARAHGVHATSLSHWRRLYQAGKLSAGLPRAPRDRSRASKTTLLPVTIAHTDEIGVRASALSEPLRRAGIVQLTFSSGTTLRIETDALDVTMVCALLAQVQR